MTAPITSNRPTTTRLHHYAGRHSHGSGIPVETFFAPAWGAITPVEIFFAHAHPKWLIFDHFHLAGAIFLSQRHPKLPPGATQGRSFFHTAPRDDTESPPVWRAPRGMEPGRGAGGRRQGQGGPRDRPLRAAGSRVAISRAGRRPPAHSAARPTGQEAQRAGRRPRAHRAARPSRHPGTPKGRVPKYPPPCRLTQPLPRRGSGRMILSPGDGDASTGTCRPRRPLPGPLRRSGRRSRCGRGSSSAWWPGRRARRNRSSRR